MAEYKRVAQDPSYQPMAAITRTEAVSAQAQKEISQMREFFNSNRIVDQQRIEDSRFAGQNWKALAEFTASGAKYYEEVAKQTAKDKATGETWDAIFDPKFRSGDFETPVISEADRENLITRTSADQLEKDGDILGSELVRKQYQGIGQGLTNERALAQQLKSRYPAEITALVNSTEMVRYNGVPTELATLYNSSDTDKVNFALSRATAMWLEKNNAQFMTKDTVVKYLGEIIPATMGYMATNVVTSNITQEKEERLAEAKTTGFNYGAGSKAEDVTKNFQALTEWLVNDNNGIVTIQRANRVAAEVMFQGAASVSEDQVKLVGNALQNPQQEGTQLRNTAPIAYMEAIQAARSNTAKANAAFSSDLITRTLKQLKEMDSADLSGKLDVVERNAVALEQRGLYQEAADLRSKAGVYTQSPEATANFMKLQKQQATGSAIPDSTLQQLVASGGLTPEQAATIRSERTSLFKDNIAAATSTVTIQNRDFSSDIALATGTVVDSASGEFKIGALSQPAINPMDLKTINKAYEKALKADLDTFALSLDPSLTPMQLNDAMEKRALAFRKAQAETPGGRFYLGGLFTADPALVRTPGTPEYERVRQAAKGFGGMSSSKPTSLPSGANNFSNSWNPGQGVSTTIKQRYRPGDRLLDPSEATAVKLDAEQGIFHPNTIKAARDLGLTPKQFIDQQITASNLGAINWNSAALKALDENPGALSNTSMIRNLGNQGYKPQDVIPGREGYRLTAVNGIPIFLSRGLSVQASSMLSAALYLLAQKKNKDIFNTKNFADKVLAEFSPAELKLLRNPNATYRQIAAIKGFDPGSISYAATLEKLFGIK